MIGLSVVPLPYKIIAALALAGAVVGSAAAYRYHVYRQGFDAAVGAREAQDAAQKTADDAKAAVDTKARQDKADSDAAQRKQEKAKYEATINDLHAAARRGNSGMRAPGACLPAAGAGASPSPAGGPVAEAGYVLLPETAESVLDAAADLRQGVLDRNALIDKYNECRAAASEP